MRYVILNFEEADAPDSLPMHHSVLIKTDISETKAERLAQDVNGIIDEEALDMCFSWDERIDYAIDELAKRYGGTIERIEAQEIYAYAN